MRHIWEGTLEHRQTIEQAQHDKADVHGAVAKRFEVDRQAAKLANFRFLYGDAPIAGEGDLDGVIATLDRGPKL